MKKVLTRTKATIEPYKVVFFYGFQKELGTLERDLNIVSYRRLNSLDSQTER